MADHLSRPIIAALLPGIDLEKIAHAQRTDPEIRAARTAITSLQLRDAVVGDIELLCDISGGTLRPLVPSILRRGVFSTLSTGSLTLARCQRLGQCQTGSSGIT